MNSALHTAVNLFSPDMKTLQLPSVDPIEQLAALSSTASLEAFSLRSITNRIVDVIPAMTHAFKQYAYTHKSDKLDLKPLTVNRTILNKALGKANYLDIVKMSTVVPQGHQGSMVDYLAIMSRAVEFTNGIRERMTSYNQLLSAIISNKNARQGTQDVSTATSSMEREREAMRIELRAHAKQGSRSDRRPLGETYRNLAEINTSMDMGSDIIARAASLNLESISTLINDAVELLDELERKANDGTISEMSPQIYKGLASATLTMARDAEFHSLMCYKAWEIKDCLETSADELVKALRY